MRLVDQSHEVLGKCPLTYVEGLSRIEFAGRMCYKSHDKIQQGSDVKFVHKIFENGHLSVAEHSNLVMRYRIKRGSLAWAAMYEKLRVFFKSKWIYVDYDENYIYVYGNWRSFFEFSKRKLPNLLLDNLINDPLMFYNIDGMEVVTDYNEVPVFAHRYTVQLLTDRAVLAEITRHRDDVAFSVESQRYCKYCIEIGDEGRYNDLICIKPWFFDEVDDVVKESITSTLTQSEKAYRKAVLEYNMSAQKARYALTNSTAVGVVMSAYIPQWMHIFSLRRATGAYPQIRKLMDGVYNDMMHAAQFKGA